MHVTEIKEIFHPEQLIEIHGKTPAEEFEDALGPYLELKNEKNNILTWLSGLAFLIFLMYFIYHLISKIRGNEKNVQLNNYGIGLSLLGLVKYSILFIDFSTYTIVHDKHNSWYYKHLTLYYWAFWSSDSAILLYHWLFNWRYVKSTFRLPVLKKSTEFHSEKLDKIIKQREDQHVLFTP